MAKSLSVTRPVVSVLVLVIVAALGVGGYFLWWNRGPEELPEPGSALYEEYVEAFQVGVAGLDADQYEIANPRLTLAIEKVPHEPAAWANRGLLHLRNNEVKEADRDLKRAQELAPENSDIEILLGLLDKKRGRFSQAVAHLRRAVEDKPRDLAARFTLAGLLLQEGKPGSDEEYQRLMEDILKVQPTNLFVLKERAGAAARRGDAKAFNDTLAQFRKLAPHWSPTTQKMLAKLEKAAAKSLKGETIGTLIDLNNSLLGEPGFSRGAHSVNPNDKRVGEALYRFLRLKPPVSSPAAPDMALAFVEGPVAGGRAQGLGADRWDVVQAVWLTEATEPAVFVASAKEVRRVDADAPPLPFPSGPKTVPPTAHGLLAVDWNNDFRTDLLLAGAAGLRFLQQEKNGTFTDVTGKTGLPAAVIQADYYGAWTADIDMDGDLDIILAPRTGPPLILQNNRDGTFTPLKSFAGVDGVRAFVWADLDNDGAADAALLDAEGRLHVFMNQRSGQFRARTLPATLGKVLALAAADVNDDGVLDLIALRTDGQLLRISDREKGQDWDVGALARWGDLHAKTEPGSVELLVADLDNNGGLDLIGTGPQGGHVWLSDSQGKFQVLPKALPLPVFAAADLTKNGRLDLLALSTKGQPVRLANSGEKNYSWQAVLPRASRKQEKPDDRINSFGIGSEIEVRAGTLVQKQVSTAPVIHFGLGERKRPDLLRIVWPTGTLQLEFDQVLNKVVVAVQRLAGSCPFLFTYDGKGMQFVTDFMWSMPLGEYTSPGEKAGMPQTESWVKIRGDQLVPRDGYYDVRTTAQLWETHYYDSMALLVVDHPPGTEIFVNERFTESPNAPQVYVTGPPCPVARAWDDRGNDVTEIVRAIDGRFVDTFERGKFRGVARDHWIEVDLGEDAPREGPLWLLAHGWVYPTDSTTGFALDQGRHERPRPPMLEIPDGKGGWKVAHADVGYPGGKNKTLMLRLDGIAGAGVTRRFRLRTNMEVYWDQLAYARGLNAKLADQQRLSPDTAELRYLGILEMTQASSSSPELPRYDKRPGRTQRWRDLIGYYTRYGDVCELLAKVDDRYVIANAGDELAMRFAVPAGPVRGWKRDFVWICDGWAKDGDPHTRFSKTVLPLPAHDLTGYDRPPGRLEDDPVYRRFPDDWKKFHTRYVTPAEFEQGLRSFRRPAP